MNDQVQAHFDAIARDYDRWKRKAHYYYDHLKRSVLEIIPREANRVCDVGCATGDMLAELAPVSGVGIDVSAAMIEIAKSKYPQFDFRVHDIASRSLDETFEYVLTVDVLEHVESLEDVFSNMARLLEPGGLLVAITPSPMWAGPLYVAEKMGRKMPEGDHRWRRKNELVGSGARAGLHLRSFDRSFVVPRDIRGLNKLNTAPRALRLRNKLGLSQRVVFERS